MRLNFTTSIRNLISRLLLLCILLSYTLPQAKAQCPVNPVLKVTAADRNGTQGTWTVPAGGPYRIKTTAKGAKGGNAIGGNSVVFAGGSGAIMIGEFIVNTGDVLSAIGGGEGESGGTQAGGGGGSGVKIGNNILIIAGGGGGASGFGNTSTIHAVTGANGNDGGIGSGIPGTGGVNGNGGTSGDSDCGGGGGAFTAGGGVADAGGGAGFGGVGGGLSLPDSFRPCSS